MDWAIVVVQNTQLNNIHNTRFADFMVQRKLIGELQVFKFLLYRTILTKIKSEKKMTAYFSESKSKKLKAPDFD
jgi:hypothetical protein